MEPEQRYKAADVCRLAGVQPYVLRYWESEFPALAADRGVPGPRSYSARDLRVIERIKKLLHDEGYTIAGAKKKLDVELKGGLLELVPPPLPAIALAVPDAEPEAVPPPPPVPPVPVAAPDLAATDPALQPLPPERPRRKRAPAEAPPAPAPREEESAPLFEGERIEVPAPPAADELATRPSMAVAPPPASDPRVARAVAELREILSLLSRDEP